MNRVVCIFNSAAVIVERFDHPADCTHSDHDTERTQDFAVTFVEKGRFGIQEGRRSWVFGVGDALVSTPGRVRSYRHFEECPDDVCLSVSFAPETVEDGLGLSRVPDPPTLIARGMAIEFASGQLRSAIGSANALWIEEMAFHSLQAMAGDSWSDPNQQPVSAAHASRIRCAIELMCADMAAGLSLSSMSREVGMSPFYFARTFFGLVGVSPHQYLIRLRLRRAATMLREGASVTTAAFSSGFENLGHFSRTFQRRFGVKPSQYPYGPG